MEIGTIIPHIEALIFASEKPLSAIELTDLINQAFGFMDNKLTLDQIETGIEGIVEKYRSEFYPFELRFSGGGWQFLTKKEYHKTVAQLNGDKFLKRLSPAAMETLAIIAYKQPITKGEIEAIRGVSADYSIQKLLEKELIVISGRNEELPGKPLVYATSRAFMDYFGLNGPEDLPQIKEVLAEQVVEPTLLANGQVHVANGDDESTTETLVMEEEDGKSLLLVSETGELLETGTIDHTETIEEDAALGSEAEDINMEQSESADSFESPEASKTSEVPQAHQAPDDFDDEDEDDDDELDEVEELEDLDEELDGEEFEADDDEEEDDEDGEEEEDEDDDEEEEEDDEDEEIDDEEDDDDEEAGDDFDEEGDDDDYDGEDEEEDDDEEENDDDDKDR